MINGHLVKILTVLQKYGDYNTQLVAEYEGVVCVSTCMPIHMNPEDVDTLEDFGAYWKIDEGWFVQL